MGRVLALLVFLSNPQAYPAYCLSGGFSWHFSFNKRGNVMASLTRLIHKRLAKLSESGSGTHVAGLDASPTTDVQFVIWDIPPGWYVQRDQTGKRATGNSVCLKDFKDWCASALFLRDIKHGVLFTPRGDLLIN